MRCPLASASLAVRSLVHWSAAWLTLTALWAAALPRVVALEPGAPLTRAALLAPPFALVLLAALWRGARLRRRRALEQGAVTTISGHRFLRASGATPSEAVVILSADPARLDAAEKEYVLEVHVARGDRMSIDYGRRSSVAPGIEALELTTATGGRETVHFDVRHLEAAPGGLWFVPPGGSALLAWALTAGTLVAAAVVCGWGSAWAAR